MIKTSFKLAMIQMKVEGGQRKKNLGHAGEKITEAARAGAQVILLPEAMDLGWTHPSALTEAQSLAKSETVRFLCREAKNGGLYICAGLIEKENNHIYNAAILINPNGQIILKHRKINELEIGLQYYRVGRDLSVCPTEFGNFAIIICADAKDTHILNVLGKQGAAVVLSPCSWAVPPDYNHTLTPYGQEWIDAYRPAAMAFSMWIAGCSNVGSMNAGPWQDYLGIGCSLIMDPDGKVVMQGPYGRKAEATLYQHIEIQERVNRHP